MLLMLKGAFPSLCVIHRSQLTLLQRLKTMSQPVSLTMIVGNVGAGKSTYAAKLSADTGAHVFNIDEWMRTLFLPDQPATPSFEWALERTERVEAQILLESGRLLDRGVNVILDMGFFSEVQRSRVRHHFLDRGIVATMHYLDVDKDTRWDRVHQRNTQQTATFQFAVSREIFDFCETIFEPLDDDERRDAILIDS